MFICIIFIFVLPIIVVELARISRRKFPAVELGVSAGTLTARGAKEVFRFQGHYAFGLCLRKLSKMILHGPISASPLKDPLKGILGLS